MNLAGLPWFGPRPAARRVSSRTPSTARRTLEGNERRRAAPAARAGARSAATAPASTTPASRALTRPAAPPARDVLQRLRHQPDYAILIAVVALTAIGILMVYSSSALKAYIQQDDTLAIVGPQILWAGVGLIALAVTMRLDYRLLRLVSLPGYLTAIVLLVLVFVPTFNRVVGGSARWIVVGPLPAVHPAEVAKLALIIYLAHWLSSRGPLVKSFRSGTIPFLVIALPLIGLVFLEPDLGTTVVI
ncbi:MAG TPA: FtsW/RodA/SpoVE family cell cycle protein, partial [Candidatus Limnocylindrales bacterium]|nr:FtsW/RodA/SpoVE family cell cycle protein [Candidatus Limnocylindrales bacterium]